MEIFYTMIFGFIGFTLYKLVNYSVSGKRNKRSPKQFDIKYWILDRNNWNDMILGCALFGIFARYKTDVFAVFQDSEIISPLARIQDNEFLYMTIGFLMTYIIKMIRKLIT